MKFLVVVTPPSIYHSGLLRLIKNVQRSDSFAAHFEQHFNTTTSRTDLRKYMTFRVVKQLNPIGSMKTFTKPNFNLCMQERLTILKKICDKRVVSYLMTDKYHMKGGSLIQYLNTKFIVSFDCLKYCDWNEKYSTYSKIVRNVDIWNFNLTNDENNNILPQHVSIAIKKWGKYWQLTVTIWILNRVDVINYHLSAVVISRTIGRPPIDPLL